MDHEPVPISFRIRRWLDKVLPILDLSRPVDRLIVKWQERQERKRWLIERGRGEAGESGAQAGVVPAWLRRWWLRGSLLCLIVAGAVFFRPALTRFREWRTDQLLERAEDELGRGEWTTAEQTAQAVLLIRKNDLRAARVSFHAQRKLGAARAAESGCWLTTQPGISDDERFDILSFLVESAPQGAFFTSFALLPDSQREAARFRSLYARFLTRRGEFDAAAKLLAAAPEKDSHPALIRERARLCCRIGEPESVREARGCFLKLVDSGKSDALAVLHFLTEIPGGLLPGPPGGFPRISDWLESMPSAAIEDQLLALDQNLAAGTPAEKVVRDAVHRFGDRDPGAVARWMNRHGRHEDVMPFATGPGMNRPALFVPLFEAQFALRLYDVAGLTLASPPPDFDPVDRAFLHLRLAAANGTAADKLWENALAAVAADRKRNRGFELADLAAAAGRAADQENAMIAACSHPGGVLPMFSDLAKLSASLASRDRLPELITIMSNLARFEAGNSHLWKNLIYLQCLHGDRKPADAIPALRAICKTETGDVYVRALAFVLLMAGNAPEAIALLEPIERRTGNDRALEATLGTALQIAGNPEKAAPFLARIKWGTGQMLPAEERCLQQLLAAAAAAAAANVSPAAEMKEAADKSGN